ncbi:hypothetical protein PFISCL1PPCAC_15801, partial [Pristionchus fissidentatus]
SSSSSSSFTPSSHRPAPKWRPIHALAAPSTANRSVVAHSKSREIMGKAAVAPLSSSKSNSRRDPSSNPLAVITCRTSRCGCNGLSGLKPSLNRRIASRITISSSSSSEVTVASSATSKGRVSCSDDSHNS